MVKDALSPASGAFTLTSLAPVSRDGVLHVSSVGELMVMSVQGVPSTETVTSETKPVPVTVTVVPPATETVLGEIAVMVGVSRELVVTPLGMVAVSPSTVT